MAPRTLGSYKPVNTLNRDHQPSIIQRPVYLKPAAFDLHETYPRREHPNKRRKISDGSIRSDVPSNKAIDLDESEAITDQEFSQATVAKSEQSRSHSGPRRYSGLIGWKGVEEFQRVEKQMNPRSGRVRERPARLSQNNKIYDSKQSNERNRNILFKESENSTQSKNNVARTDDHLKDSLSDGDVEEVTPQPRRVVRTYPQVIINQPAHRISSLRALAQAQAAGRSTPFLVSGNSHEETRNFNDSQSDCSVESLREIRHRPANSRNKEPSPPNNDSRLVIVSEDELASSIGPSSNVMQKFAKKDSPSVSTRGNIKNTEFRQSKKAKGDSGIEKYQVLSIFSETHCWLRPENAEPWLLHQDRSNGTLTPYDEEGTEIPEFVLKPQIIQKIHSNPRSEKLIIHKHKDYTASGSTKIFLELNNIDDARLLSKILKENDSTICLIRLEQTQLNQQFLHNLKLLDSMIQKRSLSKIKSKTQPQFVQLVEAKDAGSREQEIIKQEEARKSTREGRIVYWSDGDDYFPPPKRKALRESMQTRSSDTFDVDVSETSVVAPPSIESSSFYGNRTRSSSRLVDKKPPLKRSPTPRSPSPERWSKMNPNWSQDWRSSIIYPQKDKKKGKATVDKHDIERLDEGVFLNDSLIDFYLCWLEHHLEQEKPELALRVYFHNTFFYKSLTQAARGKRGINYEAVERWTSKVDLLSFDYIIVPVNENTHWYVAIICNAPKLLIPEPEVLESPQLQGNGRSCENPRDQVDMVKNSPPPSQSSPSTHITDVIQPKEFESAEVDTAMEGMSLEEKEEVAEVKDSEDEWPNDHLEPKPQTSSRSWNSELEGRKVEASPRLESDFQGVGVKPPHAKKRKRKSQPPAPRRYDLNQPRIITLDSLGMRHSPTCTNLKDYLIAEIRSKKKIDISPPGSLGMTAVNIPQQTNYSDCGVFLLSYIQEFLKAPDDFVHKILQGQELDIEFQKASDLRNYIREILLQLQKDQVAEAKKGEG